MALALNFAVARYYTETDITLNAPQSDYSPDTCQTGQLMLLSKNNSVWRCLDGTNQSALIWVKMADITDISIPSYSTPNFSSATTATKLSTTKDAFVNYTFPTSMTSALISQSITATLKYADDAAMTTNVVTVNADVQGCGGILTLTLSGALQVSGRIPMNKFRIVTLSQTGGATVPTTLSSGQEVLL